MAKYFNNIRKSGRVGGSVFAIRNGVTIERAYNPIVANPSSEGQVAQRAKFKLLSQLAAILAGVIAIPREGIVSPRNLFTKANYSQTTYASQAAAIDLEKIQLTRGHVALPAVTATRNNNNLSIALETNASNIVDRVVYVLLIKTADELLRIKETGVVSTAGADGTFPITMYAGNNDAVILAYGIRDNTDAARAAFGNIIVPTAEDVAKLLVTRTLTNSDVTLTETVGVENNMSD